MPKGPRGEKRPADVIGAAVLVGRIATGEAEETLRKDETQKPSTAAELGRMGGLKGGKARADSLTPEQRKKIASDAAKKRWSSKP